MGKHAVKFLQEYITKVRPHFTRKNRTNRHLFVDIAGKPINSHIPRMIVKKYCKAAKTKKQVSPHTFRHTCATVMLKNKANIRVIQELLGHSRLSTTQIYTHLSISDLKQTHKQCHPRERDKE
jgi:site-specific recombinase XerD